MTLFGLIPWIAKLLIGRKPSLTPSYAEKMAKGIAWGGIAIMAVLAFLAWDWWDDRQAVQNANMKRIAAENAAALEAERSATANAIERDEARDEANDQTNDELEAIHAEDPNAANAPATAGSRTVADRLR